MRKVREGYCTKFLTYSIVTGLESWDILFEAGGGYLRELDLIRGKWGLIHRGQNYISCH